MRCRKGDMKIDLQSLEGRITVFIDRDRVNDERRSRINEQIGYLGYLAMSTRDENWPISFADYRTLVASHAAAGPVEGSRNG